MAIWKRHAVAKPGAAPGAARPASGPSITLRAVDEQTVSQLTSDPYFLAGALMADGSREARVFLAVMDEGPVTHEVSRDPAGAGFIVKLTIEKD